MQRFRISLIAGLILGFGTHCVQPAGGHSVLTAMAAASASTALTATASDEDLREAFEPIKNRFRRLYRSLAAQGGIAEENIPTIRKVRREVNEFNEQHPDYTPALAAELQLSAWLDEHDRVNELYIRILRAEPDKTEFARAWIRYFERLDDVVRANQALVTVLQDHPQHIDAAMRRLRQIKQQNEYPRVIELLNHVELNPAEHPRAMLLLAECLYAENRFEDALAALNRFDDDVLEGDARVRTQVMRHRGTYTEALEFWVQEREYRSAEASADDLPRVRLETTRGEIILELFEDHAPNTVANFITLVEDGFYDGTRYHRVIPNFMAQGGDPHSDPLVDAPEGEGGPGYTIPDEHDRDDARMHFAGSISMANTGAPNSGGSQFFLTHQPTEWLNNQHTVFGRVLEGLDVVRAIERNDELIAAEVIRKRDHDYEFEKITAEEEIPEDEAVEVLEPDDDESAFPELPFQQ